jgi:plasmid stabilization system protein ParE
MKYTVLWRPFAERKLAELWTTASDRNAVTRAADRIDSMLANDPDQLGESRSGKRRVLIVEPLSVYFQVEEDDRQVWVVAVWQSRA